MQLKLKTGESVEFFLIFSILNFKGLKKLVEKVSHFQISATFSCKVFVSTQKHGLTFKLNPDIFKNNFLIHFKFARDSFIIIILR